MTDILNELRSGDCPIEGPQNTTDYKGWIEDKDKTWILFIRHDGTPHFYGKRDPETGAVIEPKESTNEAINMLIREKLVEMLTGKASNVVTVVDRSVALRNLAEAAQKLRGLK